LVKHLNIFERETLSTIFQCVMANPTDSVLCKAKRDELKTLTERPVREGRLEGNIYDAMLTAFIQHPWMYGTGKGLESIEIAERYYPFGEDEVNTWRLESDLGL